MAGLKPAAFVMHAMCRVKWGDAATHSAESSGRRAIDIFAD